MVKMLSAVPGGLDFSSVPEADRHRAQWAEAAWPGIGHQHEGAGDRRHRDDPGAGRRLADRH